MAIPKPLAGRAGSYAGKSKLHLSFLPEGQRVMECTSELHVEFDRNSQFATVTYVWEQDGNKEEGSYLICGSPKSSEFQMAWVDSWHLNYEVMHLTGSGDALDAKGKYTVEGEDWAWRIAFEFPSGSEIAMKMWFYSQEGEEEWAVEGHYKKV